MFRLTNRLLLIVLILVPTIGLSPACQRKPQSTSVIVISAEGLGADDIHCADSQDRNQSGFNLLCHEFLQVKGVVASSTSSVASMAALFTGESPHRLGLFTNNDFLSASYVTIAEKLFARGWRTGFFFASPPLSRKSGLSQGFESADDSIQNRRAFRSSEEVFSNLIHWMTEDSSKNVFATISISDLIHPEIETLSDKGEIRAKSFESQLEEIDESLFHFFQNLKKYDRFNKSWIVFTGLQGRRDPTDKLPRPLQIKPKQLVVPTFFKPITESGEPKVAEGTWTHSELGKVLKDIVTDERSLQMDRSTLLAKLRLHEPIFVSSQGCVQTSYGSPFCRVAFFGSSSWIPWDAKLPLDSQGKHDLFRRIEALPKDLIPPKFDRRQVPAVKDPVLLSTFNRCLSDFPRADASSTFAGYCPSRAIQFLHEIFHARGNESRETRNQFIRRWTDLALAQRIYDWNLAQQIDLAANLDTVAEFQILEKIMSRPELTEIRKECERAISN